MTILFDELDLEKNCPIGTYNEGKLLYKQNTIKRIDIEKKLITGKLVIDTEVYYPEIIVKFDRLVSRCSCEQKGFCEHSVALGLTHIYGIQSQDSITAVTNSDNIAARLKTIFSPKKENKSDFNLGIMLDIKSDSGTYSIFFYNKDTQEIIAQPEQKYKEILSSKNLNDVTKSFINFCIEKEYWQFFSPLKYYKVSEYLNHILTTYPDIELTSPTNNNKFSYNSQSKIELSIKKTKTNYLISGCILKDSFEINLSGGIICNGINDYLIIKSNIFKMKNKIHAEVAKLFILPKQATLTEEEIPEIIGDLSEILANNHIKLHLDNKLKEIKIIKLSPDIELHVQEQNENLMIFPVYKYPEHDISEKFSDSLYTKTQINNKETYIKKDKNIFGKINSFLYQYGFQKNGDIYFSNGQNAIRFLYNAKNNISQNYILKYTGQFNTFKISEHDIIMTINIAKKDDNISVSPEFSINNKKIKNSIINEAIAKKHQFVKTDSGYALIPGDDINYLLEIQSNYGSQSQIAATFNMPEIRYGVLINRFMDNIVQSKSLEKFHYDKIEQSKSKEIVINATLRNYQQEGIKWLNHLYQNKWGGILADDMGLGKTIQAIAILSKAHSIKTNKSIIICPTSLLENWKREIAKFCPTLKTSFYYGSNREKELKKENIDILISTYGTVRNDLEKLSDYTFNYVILDEAQNIKNEASATAKSIKQIKNNYRLALTGTPLENNLMELWSIFDFTTPGLLSSKSDFERQFMLFENEDSSYNFAQLKNTISPFILRRTKQEVLTDLPEKIETTNICSANLDFKEAYNSLKNKIKKSILGDVKDTSSFKKQTSSVFTALLRLRQFCCHPSLISTADISSTTGNPKFEQLKEHINQIKQNKHKVLVFSQFTSMLSIMRNWIEDEEIDYCYLDGSTKNRQKVVDEFNNSDSKVVFLISLKAGGTGLNLTSADYVIHYDPWWNPAVEAQATDRAHRIGQKNTVFSYKLVTEGTIEERIIELQERKKALFDNIVSENNISQKMTYDDLEFLLS